MFRDLFKATTTLIEYLSVSLFLFTTDSSKHIELSIHTDEENKTQKVNYFVQVDHRKRK